MTVERPKDEKELFVFLGAAVVTAAVILVAIPYGTPYKTYVGGVLSPLAGYFAFLAYRRRRKS